MTAVHVSLLTNLKTFLWQSTFPSKLLSLFQLQTHFLVFRRLIFRKRLLFSFFVTSSFLLMYLEEYPSLHICVIDVKIDVLLFLNLKTFSRKMLGIEARKLT